MSLCVACLSVPQVMMIALSVPPALDHVCLVLHALHSIAEAFLVGRLLLPIPPAVGKFFSLLTNERRVFSRKTDLKFFARPIFRSHVPVQGTARVAHDGNNTPQSPLLIWCSFRGDACIVVHSNING